MNEQAKRLGELYLELAEKDTWLEFNFMDTYGWGKTYNTPSIASDLDRWRIAEKPVKKIDMSCLDGSDIDMEFGNNNSLGFASIGKLYNIETNTETRYSIPNSKGHFTQCRVRQDHWHSWRGGDCPLPKGLIIGYSEYKHSRRWVNHCTSYTNLDWSEIYEFKVFGVADGWEY
jgi:hypothetical protein